MSGLPRRCPVCRRTGHTNRAHADLTGPELAALKADGLAFMGRGFRELGVPAPDGDLLDQLRADTERAQLAESVPGTADLLGALQDSVDRARAGRRGDPGPSFARPPEAPDVARWTAEHEASEYAAYTEPRQAGRPAELSPYDGARPIEDVPLPGDAPATEFRPGWLLGSPHPGGHVWTRDRLGGTWSCHEGEVPHPAAPELAAELTERAEPVVEVVEAEADLGPDTSASPANCQSCGSVLDDGQSFLCGACAFDPGASPEVPNEEDQFDQGAEEVGLAALLDHLGEQCPQLVPWRTWRGPAEPIRITKPGVYELTAAEYHDPIITGEWLSNSDARQLIGDGCPAQFRYDRDNGVRKTSAAFSMGHAVHARILGKGEQIAVRPAEFDSWRTKASQAWRAEQERAGRSVILPEDADVVEAMASAVHEKPRAHELLSQPGRPEMCLFWVDAETGVQRRCMVDYLPSVVDQYGVMEPVDIKSADSVAPTESMERKLYDHAWHRQGTTIADGIVALGLAREVEFYFIVQSKTAPHLVTVVKLDADAERIGRIENRQAMLVYRQCLETGVWPDYAEHPVTLTVPPWIARIYEEDVH